MATENNTHINSFHKGMDTDTSYAALEEGKYSLAKNIRIVSTGYSNPTVTNAQFEVRPIRGVKNIADWDEQGKPTITFDRILATNSIREYGLIVAAGKANDNDDKEWFVFSFDSNDVGNTLKLIFRSHKPTDKKRFSTVTKYEDTNIVKLYIATGEDPLIVLNILDKDLYKRTLDQVRAYPAITFTPPKFKQLLVGGFLKPGLVQYSYRLYNKNGVSTDISPTTKLIPVVNYYGEEVNKAGVQGYLEEDQPSIGAEITIDIAPSYDDYLDRVQVFRIQYVHNGQLPTIECIQDTRVSTLREGNKLTIRDTSNLVLSTLTLEEYNSMSGIHILPGIIESKYDYMFASKIKEESDWMTDEEYDAVTITPELITDTLAGDYSPMNNDYITHNTISHTANDYSTLEGYVCELPSYAEPETFMNRKSLRRGEVYRYGVVFYNKYGEASRVKRLRDDINVPYNSRAGLSPVTTQEADLKYNSLYYSNIQPVEYVTEGVGTELRYYVCDALDHVSAWIIDNDTVEHDYQACYNNDGYWRFKLNNGTGGYLIYADPEETMWNEIEFEGYCSDEQSSISIVSIGDNSLFPPFVFNGTTVRTYKLSGQITRTNNGVTFAVSGDQNSSANLWLKIKLRYVTKYTFGYDAFSTNEQRIGQTPIELTTKPIGVRFTINNIPEEAVAYEIVRCNRTESDIKCLAQGVLSRPIRRIAAEEISTRGGDQDIELNKYPYTPSGYLTTADFYREDYTKFAWDSYKDPFVAMNYTNGSVFQFISPEISYQKESFKALLKNKKISLLPIQYLYPNSECHIKNLLHYTEDSIFGVAGRINTKYFTAGSSGAGMYYLYNWITQNINDYQARQIKDYYDSISMANGNSFTILHRDGGESKGSRGRPAMQALLYAQANRAEFDATHWQSAHRFSRTIPTHDYLTDGDDVTIDGDSERDYANIKTGWFGYIKLYKATQSLYEGYKYDDDDNRIEEPIDFPGEVKINAHAFSNDLGWDDVFSVSGNQLKSKYNGFEIAVGNNTYNNIIMGGQYGTPTENGNVAFKKDEGGPFNADVGYNFYALGGPCLLIQTENLQDPNNRDNCSPLTKTVIGDLVTDDVDRNLTQKQFGTFLCNLTQNVNPYGGDSANAIQLSTYYSYGNYHVLGDEDINHSSSIEVYDGDCMIQPFEYMSAHKYYTGYAEHSGLSFSMIYSVPVETSINLSYTLGQEFSKGLLDVRKSNSQLQVGNVYGRYVQDKPLYSYNSAYSSNAYTRAFAAFTELEDRNDLNDPDYRVYHSLLKSVKENTDNWTKFQPANFIDVDSKYGPVTDLKSFNNQLIFWQADAVGVLSVNERAVVSTDNNTPLILGTGGVLDRYDYIDKTSGMVEGQFVKANSDTTLYWWNDKVKQIFAYKTGSTVEELGKTKRVQNALYSKDDSENTPTMFFNNKYNEVVTNSLADKNQNKNQIAYSEFLQAFTSLYTFNYEDAVEFTDKDYLVSLHDNKGALRVSKYDDSDSTTNTDGNLMNAYLQYVVNKNVLSTKVFDNQELVTVNIPGGAGIERNEQRNKDTDSYFTQHHEYKWETDLNNSDTEELAMTLREGNYRYAIPRANNSSVGNRIRGKYMVCSIEDTNPNCDASISYIITKFRTSWS